MLKRTNSNISNVFMKFWYIEHYGACYGDGIDAKMNYYNHTKWSMEIVSNICSVLFNLPKFHKYLLICLNEFILALNSTSTLALLCSTSST